MLKVTEKKIDIDAIFKQYLEDLKRKSYYRGWDDYDYGCWCGYDDYDDYDNSSWYDDYCDFSKSKKTSKKKEHNSSPTLIWSRKENKFIDLNTFDKTNNRKDYVNRMDDDDIPNFDSEEELREYLHSKYDEEQELINSCYETKSCRGKKQTKKRAIQVSDMTYNSKDKYIYVYPNVNERNPHMEFNSLKELDEYLGEINANATEEATHILLREKTIHCTVKRNPETLENELVAEKSYGALCLECNAITNSNSH